MKIDGSAPDRHEKDRRGRSPVRRHSLAIVLGLLVLAGAMIGNPEAFAGSTVGDFEIDGNLVDDPAGGSIDWSTDPEGNFPHPGLPNRVDFVDASGQSDGIFGQGSKELEPGGWTCVTGSAPGKSDILKGSVAIRAIGQKRFMYVNFLRLKTDGDVHMDYEFNQSSEPNPACAALGAQAPKKRTAGDILITFDTETGGKIIRVRAFEWMGDHMVGTFEEFPLGSQGVLWDAAVNIPNTIPGVEAGAFGEAVLNITDSPIRFLCPEFAYMKTRSSSAINSELKDRTAPLKIVFADRPDLALAEKSAFGAFVSDTLLGINQTMVPVSSHQQGVGRDEQSAQLLDVAVTGVPLQAAVLRSSSASEITNAPAQAKHTSVAEAANVNVLNGLVTASFVRGVATATATGSSSSFSAIGSAFTDLRVNGKTINNVTPNTRIDLSTSFGKGSYVLLFERVGSTSTPAPGQIEGGTYAANLTVNMIHVVITGLPPLNQRIEVIVSNAVAHADFPQRELCAIPPEQMVSGHAFIASATTDPSLVPTTLGFTSIPANGGLDHQDLDEATIGSEVSAGASVSESSGALSATNSTASSFAQATGVCITTGCAISAALVKSQSNSTANGGASSDPKGTELVGLIVMGTPVSANPPPNTTIDLPGIGFVILNEQFCDNNGTLANKCSDGTVPGHSGLTVRAIHVVVTVPDNPAGLQEGEVIVAEAHSDAVFIE
jgi:hypothetical protein